MNYTEKVKILNRLKLRPRSWDNQFVCNLQKIEFDENFTSKQKKWVDNLFYRYRKQIVQPRFKHFIQIGKEAFLNAFEQGCNYILMKKFA